jgi:hypothetical protein
MRTSQKIGVGALVLIAVATVVAIKNPMHVESTFTSSSPSLPPDELETMEALIKLQGAPCGYVKHAQRVDGADIVGTCTNGLAYRAVHVAGGWQLQRMH